MIEAFAIVGASLGAAHSSHEPVVLQTFPQLRDAALPPSLAAVRLGLTASGSSLQYLPGVSRYLRALLFASWSILSCHCALELNSCLPPVLFSSRMPPGPFCARQFCLPHGVQFTRLPEEPRFFGFATARAADGRRTHVGCLVIYEPVARGASLAAALASASTSASSSAVSRIGPADDVCRLHSVGSLGVSAKSNALHAPLRYFSAWRC
jgi:hypothetical protein